MALLPRHNYEVLKRPRCLSAKNCLRFQGFSVKAKYRIAELRSDSISCLTLAVPTPLPHTTSAFLRLSWWSLRARGRCTKDFGVPTHDQCRFPLTHAILMPIMPMQSLTVHILHFFLHNFSAFQCLGGWQVVKVAGKFTPIPGWLHFNALEAGTHHERNLDRLGVSTW